MPKQEVDSSYVPDSDAVRHMVGKTALIQVPGVLTVKRVPNETMDVVFRAEVVAGILRPTAVTVRSSVGDEITATHLRAVNVKTLWRLAIIKHIEFMRYRGRGIRLTDGILEKFRLRGPDADTLEYVATVYSLAKTLGLAPALFVQEAFAGESLEPLPRTTATKWIKKARDVGLIQESGLLADPMLDEADRNLLRAVGFAEDDNGND